ncbi:MAG: hypothetical protein GYA21_15090 [Myxococcales bacterium]|nr:hypothetical protein [Myxococcales bacterium]
MLCEKIGRGFACAGGLMLLFWAGATQGQELGKHKPGKQVTELLGGRLQVRMPEKARVEGRQHSIMAAPEALTEETRVVLDAGNERLVLMAWELFATSGGDLAKAVAADVAKWGDMAQGAKVEPLPVPKPLQDARLAIPGKHDLSREAILVLAAYVESADGTVQMLAFYVNPAGAKDLGGCTALAKSVAQTIGAGAKRLDLSAGKKRFAGAGDKDFLALDVPAGFVATTQQGPDFSVYRLRRVSVLGEPGASIGIYLGGHPSYQHKQARDEKLEFSTAKGKLLGQEVEWHTWSRGPAATTEAILPHPGAKGLFLHLFLSAAGEAALAPLRAIAETIKIEHE